VASINVDEAAAKQQFVAMQERLGELRRLVDAETARAVKEESDSAGSEARFEEVCLCVCVCVCVCMCSPHLFGTAVVHH
jgi:hypothetical protein